MTSTLTLLPLRDRSKPIHTLNLMTCKLPVKVKLGHNRSWSLCSLLSGCLPLESLRTQLILGWEVRHIWQLLLDSLKLNFGAILAPELSMRKPQCKRPFPIYSSPQSIKTPWDIWIFLFRSQITNRLTYFCCVFCKFWHSESKGIINTFSFYDLNRFFAPLNVGDYTTNR